jgi:cobalt-zinc-cadmium resistance protein CzcA
MLSALVAFSIRARRAMLVLLALLLGAGYVAAVNLPVDALPDVSTIQVSVLTTASGLTPTEIERAVTTPLENALNGIPNSAELRSVSRAGLSVVTVVFDDDMDVWFARQLVLERIRGVELPPAASAPELAPVSTGLGEIYQFVVRSDQHSPMQLRTLLDWEIVPKLRNLPGVIEVNTMGGELKQYQVVVDPSRLRASGLALLDVVKALEGANLDVGGGYIERNKESFTIRGQGLLRSTQDIKDVVLFTDAHGTPVLVRHVAEVHIAPALRYGAITLDGKSEAVTGIVMMLLGENSKDVTAAVVERVAKMKDELPPGVVIDTIYDRSDFVSATLGTVMKNLVEGVLVVALVLTLFLGSIPAALAVILGVPAAMSVALFGMHACGVTGDLMSLGAIDFGFLVDGPIVIVEAVIAATAGRKLSAAARTQAYTEIASNVARPVAFAVAIIMLVYLPLLGLEGVEGKMFKPMAITMASALLGALIYAVVFFPAVLVTLVRPARAHGPRWIEALGEYYARRISDILSLRWALLACAILMLGTVGWAFASSGAEFLPRIFEGDAVVTIRRAPSISLEQAQVLDLEAEKVLMSFPEVERALAQTGRAEVATDPVGNDNTDIVLNLRPLSEWQTGEDFDELSVAFKEAIESRVPGTFVSVSQPIEDRTNEMISGSRADVQIQLFGNDLERLSRLAQQIGDVVKNIQGTGDVRVERVLGASVISAVADRARMARYGVRVEDAFAALSAAREGIKVGDVYESERKFDLRVLEPPTAATADAFGNLFVETARGDSIPLREVVTLSEGDAPTAVRREARRRAIRVDVNLRGRDLVSWVAEAKAKVAAAVDLPSDYTLKWGGQFENFERAQRRLALVVPLSMGIIFAMLLWMFQNLRLAAAVFALVPLSLVGGMFGLLLRGLSFSLPAAVGFIALGGIAVLNGVVVAGEVQRRVAGGEPVQSALCNGCAHTLRAVLTTATVAAFGFLPMALATGAGAEVQRPLATVVVIGMLFGTALALLVLPGLLWFALQGSSVRDTHALPSAHEAPGPI